MKYGTPKCPECGQTLAGECDLIPGRAEVFEREDGTFEYTGNTEVFWDGQANETNEEAHVLTKYKIDARDAMGPVHDLVRVECSKAHQWDTTREDA